MEQTEKHAFAIQFADGRRIDIYANGRVTGLDTKDVIFINHIPSIMHGAWLAGADGKPL